MSGFQIFAIYAISWPYIRAKKFNRKLDYPDVEASTHAQLLSLGVEVYGRWSDQSLILVRQLARFKARNSPEILRKSVEVGYYKRWWSLLSVAVQKMVLTSILRPTGTDLQAAATYVQDPFLADVLDFAR